MRNLNSHFIFLKNKTKRYISFRRSQRQRAADQSALFRSRARASTNTRVECFFDPDHSRRLECTTRLCLGIQTRDCRHSRPRNSPSISRHKCQEEWSFVAPSSLRVALQLLRMSPSMQDVPNTVPDVTYIALGSVADDLLRLGYRTPPSPTGAPMRTPTGA